MWRWIIRERMVWQWTQLSREEPRGLQQIVCRLNSTTCPQGPNNRKTLRNTHCCSDCHIPQIINCQGSCHPPPVLPVPLSFFYHLPSLTQLLLGGVLELSWSLITYWHLFAVFIHEWSYIARSRGRRRAQGREWEDEEVGEWTEVELIFDSHWYSLGGGCNKTGTHPPKSFGFEGVEGFFCYSLTDTSF